MIVLLNRNPGEYNKKIKIIQKVTVKDKDGFDSDDQEKLVLQTYAKIKTTSGFTLFVNDTDFEKALTNFTIRYPITLITRDMFVVYNNNYYSIEYLNNIDEANIELEIQAKLVVK